MSFTTVFALFGFILLALIFGFTYKTKGLRTAFIATGIAFVIINVLFWVIMFAALRAMHGMIFG